MRAIEILTESKKIDASKPRNFVAKNAKMGGAGAHKDKKKAQKQGDTKHKQKAVAEEAAQGSKVQQIESMIAQLEQLMPAVLKAQKNHYEFEAIEDELTSMMEGINSIADDSAKVDMTDSIEEAVQAIRAANGAVYNIEKTLKSLIKFANYALDDARDEEQYESRFGSVEEAADIPFAGKKVGQKEGPAGQLKGKDPKGYPKGKLVGGGM
jgi:DNA repair exonuclease SbcCD ATPase subunit